MNSVVQSRASVLALLMALMLGLILAPAAVVAAPLNQDAEPVIIGYYQSDVMPAGPDAELQISLTLFDDQTAEVVSDYLEDEPPIIEIGTWVQNEDGSVTLTVTGTDTEPYEEPIELTFALDEDGALSIPGVEGGAFGTEGLTLAPAEIPAAAPVQAEATPAAIEEPDTEAAAEEAPTTEITPTVEVTPTDEITAGAEITSTAEITPAAEEPAAADPEAEVYLSDLLPVDIGEGRQISLTVNVDGTAEMVTDLMNGEPPQVESGEWARSSGVLTVTLTADAEGAYAEPLVYAFQEQEDGSLVLPGAADGPFGVDGLTLTASEQAEAIEGDITGVYASDILPAASAPGMIILAILYEDGNAQVSSYYLTGEPPIVEIGAWAMTGDASVTITATGTLEGDYELPTSAVFDVTEGGLVAGTVTLNRLPAAGTEDESQPEPSPVARFQTVVMPAAADAALRVLLTLYDDSSAEMVSDYQNDEAPVVEVGTWTDAADGTLVLTLTGSADAPEDEPLEMVFEVQDDGSLVALEYPQDSFGEDGLTFTPLPTEGAAGEPVEEPADEPTNEPDTTADPTAETGPGIAGGMVFQSATLPAASGPGREITLSLLDNGSAIMSTDFLNDEPAVTEFGEWVQNDDGTLSLTLTEGPNGAYDEPVEIAFAINDDNSISAVEYDEAIFGTEGLELAPAGDE